MKNVSFLAGIGGVSFTVLFILATIVGAPLGGTYKASDVTDYLARGHRPAVIVALYLALIAIAGLILFLARFRTAVKGPWGTLYWGASIGAVTLMFAGYSIALSPSLIVAYGGSAVAPAPPVGYDLAEIGWVVAYGAGGTLLGVALLALVLASAGVPAWVRWSGLVAAIAALAAPAWFPFFVVLLWVLVVGVWLLVADRALDPAPTPQPA